MISSFETITLYFRDQPSLVQRIKHLLWGKHFLLAPVRWAALVYGVAGITMPRAALRPREFCHLFLPSSQISQLPIAVSEDPIHMAFSIKRSESVSLVEDGKLLDEGE